LRLENHTDISDSRIRKIIRFVRPNRISGFDLRISNSKYLFAGTAYPNGSSLHRTSNPFIVVRVTDKETKFPYLVEYNSQTRVDSKSKPQIIMAEARSHNTSNRGYIDHLLLSREEAIIHVVAHELRHLWQKNHRKCKVWGSRGRYREKDADAYAIRKTREWRRKNSHTIVATDRNR
jgi:hypothetical protein